MSSKWGRVPRAAPSICLGWKGDASVGRCSGFVQLDILPCRLFHRPVGGGDLIGSPLSPGSSRRLRKWSLMLQMESGRWRHWHAACSVAVDECSITTRGAGETAAAGLRSCPYSDNDCSRAGNWILRWQAFLQNRATDFGDRDRGKKSRRCCDSTAVSRDGMAT